WLGNAPFPPPSNPARTRARRYSGVRFSNTTVSIPANPNSRDSNKPDGPAPTIPTWVRMEQAPNLRSCIAQCYALSRQHYHGNSPLLLSVHYPAATAILDRGAETA